MDWIPVQEYAGPVRIIEDPPAASCGECARYRGSEVVQNCQFDSRAPLSGGTAHLIVKN